MELWNKTYFYLGLSMELIIKFKTFKRSYFSFGGLMNIHYTFQDCVYVSESILNLERLGKISETYIDGLPKLG